MEEDFEVIGVSVLPHWPLYDDKIDLFGRLGAGQVNWNERNGRVITSYSIHYTKLYDLESHIKQI